MTIIDYITVWMQNTLKVMELKVNWDNKICKLIHRKYRQIKKVNMVAQNAM